MKQLTYKDLLPENNKHICFDITNGNNTRKEGKSYFKNFFSKRWKGSVLDLVKRDGTEDFDAVWVTTFPDWITVDEKKRVTLGLFNKISDNAPEWRKLYLYLLDLAKGKTPEEEIDLDSPLSFYAAMVCSGKEKPYRSMLTVIRANGLLEPAVMRSVVIEQLENE